MISNEKNRGNSADDCEMHHDLCRIAKSYKFNLRACGFFVVNRKLVPSVSIIINSYTKV